MAESASCNHDLRSDHTVSDNSPRRHLSFRQANNAAPNPSRLHAFHIRRPQVDRDPCVRLAQWAVWRDFRKLANLARLIGLGVGVD